MQDNVFEFWSGDYGLRLYVDQLDSFPIKNFRLCLRILRGHPEDLERLEAALQQYKDQAMEDWKSASKAFVDGYKKVLRSPCSTARCAMSPTTSPPDRKSVV